MLLDRQGPEVSVSSRQIALKKKDVVKYWLIIQPAWWKPFWIETEEHEPEDQDIKRWIKLEPPAYREPTEINPPAPLEFGESRPDMRKPLITKKRSTPLQLDESPSDPTMIWGHGNLLYAP